MATMEEATIQRTLIGRLAHNADLIEEITDLCSTNHIQLGQVTALGAVSKARVGFYNQVTREYQFLELDKHLEITALVGNISLKDGAPIVHAHITLSDDAGNAFGGHLASGTTIFACECIIHAMSGPTLQRGFDQDTGLPLWNM